MTMKLFFFFRIQKYNFSFVFRLRKGNKFEIYVPIVERQKD